MEIQQHEWDILVFINTYIHEDKTWQKEAIITFFYSGSYQAKNMEMIKV